jgi:hypothetical protein
MSYPEQQAEYDWLVSRWARFRERPFPDDCPGTDVAGVCLVMLDAGLAALVSSYVERRRQWHPRGIDNLRRLHDDLGRVLPSLTDKAADYFTEWDGLVATTLRLLGEE